MALTYSSVFDGGGANVAEGSVVWGAIATKAKEDRDEAQMKIAALSPLANTAKPKWTPGELDTALKLLPGLEQTQAGVTKALRAAEEELE
jgi:hypothetical protein